MKLEEKLKQLNKKKLIVKANNHNLYFNNQFSKAWIIKKIKDKLLNENYLKKLIDRQFSQESIASIKKIIKNGKIDSAEITSTSLKQLQNKLFAFSKNNKIILTSDLQKKLTKVLIPSHKNNNHNIEIENETKKLPFFFYVLLILNKRKKSPSFVNKINTSAFSDDKFYQIITNYCKEVELITKNNNKSDESLKYWLQESYNKKILTLIKIFFPDYNKILRQIIAVLAKYPKNKTISNSFLLNELKIKPFSKQNKLLLEFFDIIKFNKDKLQLSDFCWKIFTKNYEFIQPDILEEKVIVSRQSNLSLLWFVINNATLIKIGNKLTFKIVEQKEFLKDFKTLLAK